MLYLTDKGIYGILLSTGAGKEEEEEEEESDQMQVSK